jgi:ribosome-associated toxin RatA of RatAB toxin-antitoxin module
MRTENTIVMRSPIQKVFDLAADVSRWPDLLPHYRWVRTHWHEGDTSVVEMAALRSGIPVKWTSVQQLSRHTNRIYYKHIGGITRGMWVEWSLAPVDGGTRVAIIHDMTLLVPVVRSLLGKWITGEVFVKHVADETLRHMKSAVEA